MNLFNFDQVELVNPSCSVSYTAHLQGLQRTIAKVLMVPDPTQVVLDEVEPGAKAGPRARKLRMTITSLHKRVIDTDEAQSAAAAGQQFQQSLRQGDPVLAKKKVEAPGASRLGGVIRVVATAAQVPLDFNAHDL